MAIIGSAMISLLSATAGFVKANASWLVPTVGILGAAGGGTASAITAHQQQAQQAQAAADNARMQQQQMEYNKRMEEREAAAVEAETAENVRRQRLESERLRSAQIALLGKSGAAMASGSPLAVLGATALDEERKAQDMHYAGARSAAAHRAQAVAYGFGASIAGQNIKAAKASKPSAWGLAGNLGGVAANTLGNVGNYVKAGKAVSQVAGKTATALDSAAAWLRA